MKARDLNGPGKCTSSYYPARPKFRRKPNVSDVYLHKAIDLLVLYAYVCLKTR